MRSKQNFSDLFLDDYECNNYIDEEPKAFKEELDDLPPLKEDEKKSCSVPATPLSKGEKQKEKDLKS